MKEQNLEFKPLMEAALFLRTLGPQAVLVSLTTSITLSRIPFTAAKNLNAL